VTLQSSPLSTPLYLAASAAPPHPSPPRRAAPRSSASLLPLERRPLPAAPPRRPPPPASLSLSEDTNVGRHPGEGRGRQAGARPPMLRTAPTKVAEVRCSFSMPSIGESGSESGEAPIQIDGSVGIGVS
jgi:hypothetical protein